MGCCLAHIANSPGLVASAYTQGCLLLPFISSRAGANFLFWTDNFSSHLLLSYDYLVVRWRTLFRRGRRPCFNAFHTSKYPLYDFCGHELTLRLPLSSSPTPPFYLLHFSCSYSVSWMLFLGNQQQRETSHYPYLLLSGMA